MIYAIAMQMTSIAQKRAQLIKEKFFFSTITVNGSKSCEQLNKKRLKSPFLEHQLFEPFTIEITVKTF